MKIAAATALLALSISCPTRADDALPPNSNDALPPNTNDCAQFDKNGDAWKARGMVVFTLGDDKETLSGASVSRGQFVFKDIDLYDLLEKKCASHRG
jgi:hypothetical protein